MGWVSFSLEIFVYKVLAKLIVIIMVASATGCGHLFKPPVDDPKARLMVDRLQQVNSELEQFKGLANIQMISDLHSQSGRIAFAAVKPDKMRVELLNMIGTPITSLSGDGETITILSHSDQRYYRLRQTPTALEALIQIPIGIEDLQSLLAGRVPIPRHATVHSKSTDTDSQNQWILFKNRWHGVVARLAVDRRTERIETLQVIDHEGELQYQIRWLQWQVTGPYNIPSKLFIESASKQKLTLKMDRFWPDAVVAPSTFVLDLSRR